MLPEYLAVNTTEYWFTPWPERLRHFRQDFGFQSVEIGFNTIETEDDYQQVQSLIKQYDLRVVSGHDWFHFLTPNDPAEVLAFQNRLVHSMERTRELGADKLVWYTGENPLYADEKAVPVLLDRLQPALQIARKLGMTLLLESEFSANGTDPAASVSTLKSMMQMANDPHLGINYDPANLYTAGEEAFPLAYHELKPWIRHIHLKGVELYHRDHHDELTRDEGLKGCGRIGVCTSLPKSAVNFLGLLHALQADEYSGEIVLETHVPEAVADATLEESIQFVLDHYSRA